MAIDVCVREIDILLRPDKWRIKIRIIALRILTRWRWLLRLLFVPASLITLLFTVDFFASLTYEDAWLHIYTGIDDGQQITFLLVFDEGAVMFIRSVMLQRRLHAMVL